MQTITPIVVRDIVDSAEEREMWIVSKEMERAPYWFAEEGLNARLIKAIRVVQEDRILPNSDGSYTVTGSEKRQYRCAESCSCPQSQKGKSKWCYHMCAVALYVEWRKRCAPAPPLRPLSPVALGTLRAGTAPLAPVHDDADTLGNGYPVDDETLPLPLPPTSVEERLAQPTGTPEPLTLQVIVDERLALSTLHDATALSTHHTPQEDRMPDDAYMPAPGDLPTTAVDEPPAPVPLRIPREYTVIIKGKTHVLYTGLVVTARLQGLMSLSADWTYNDAELSLAHAVCTFTDGRRYEESGDATPSNVGKGIAAHFRRVALTRAKARCLRDALGISECSVEELDDETGKRETPDMTRPPSEKDLRSRIWKIVQARAPQVKSREAVDAWVMEHTGLALHPDEYADILATLEGREVR